MRTFWTYAERALRLSSGLDYSSYAKQEAVRFAVRYCLMVIGESAYSLSEEAKAAEPRIPWADLAAMRHRLVHGYGAISDLIVYNTLAEDLPFLIDVIRAALARNEQQP